MPWAQGLPKYKVNYTPFKRNQRSWRWPAWRVGLKQEDFFDDLYDRFNMTSIRILEPEAFLWDVRELAQRSSNKDEFYARLRWRMEYRLAELQCFASRLKYMFFPAGYNQLDPHQSLACHRALGYPSVDLLVAFFAAFVTRDRRGQLPSECEPDAYTPVLCHFPVISTISFFFSFPLS